MESQMELAKILAKINDPELIASFLEELCTARELNDLVSRWLILKELHRGRTQRQVSADHNLGLCKITRGSKVLKKTNSTSKKLLDQIYGDKK